MSEKEREEELFKRAEKREMLKKRYEIEKKLKMQKKKSKVCFIFYPASFTYCSDTIEGCHYATKNNTTCCFNISLLKLRI